MKIPLLSLSLALGLSVSTVARAETVLSTYDWPPIVFGAWSLSNNTDVPEYLSSATVGIGFVTGDSEGGYGLDSVTFGFLDAVVGTSGTVSVALYGDAGGGYPDYGQLLGLFSGTSTPLVEGDVTFAADVPFSLEASTVYWIVLEAENVDSGSYLLSGVYTSNLPAPDPVSGWMLDFVGYYVNLDQSWYEAYPDLGESPAFAINATAVPEPGSMALLMGAGLVLLLWRRRAPVALRD